ncbi:MAG: primosomal protein N' [Bacillota bacterium]|nr:primosomal protein N' [Bacillota bacterium]
MRSVELLIDIPTGRDYPVYTYFLPESMQQESLFGKRVLVDFAGQKREGYVIKDNEIALMLKLKPVLRLLDEETVFDHTLLQLAYWMSEEYFCSPATALGLMVPPSLRKKKAKVLIPCISKELFNDEKSKGREFNESLFEEIWEKGEISLTRALSLSDQEEIEQLIKEGYLIITGQYKSARPYLDQYSYVPGPALNKTFDVEKLKRKAPRQAEILNSIIVSGQVEANQLHKEFPVLSIKTLLNKELIMKVRNKTVIDNPGYELTLEQLQAVQILTAALHDEQNREFLLYGITGSGKTEVYVHAAQVALNKGKGVIVLVPEIALTRQLVSIFSSRIPEIAVLHSGMSQTERYNQWERIRNGDARLVLGPRSAIFAPIADLGLIIMDEEQENSYKQEEFPKYHARDVARKRASIEDAVLLLGSATPSMETFYGAMTGLSKLISLPERIGEADIPEVIIEDLRQSYRSVNGQVLSSLLQSKIQHRLAAGEQTILFINRRGYSPMTICRECGSISTCPSCSVGMTFHQDMQVNMCHYCNYQESLQSKCKNCGSNHLQMVGAGTQKIEQEVKKLYPRARVARLDIDTSKKKGSQLEILEGMKSGDIDILIGTQMVAKGLDYPRVSLVGIIDADSMLNLPDFRAGERCFQLLVQAAGRAGRGVIPGEVIIQTYNPQHPVIEMAASQNYLGFYMQEIKNRKLLQYPPFCYLLRIVISGELEDECVQFADFLTDFISEVTDSSEEELTVLGPARCPIFRIRRRFRYQMLIKSTSLLFLNSLGRVLTSRDKPAGLRIEIEMNPIITM